MVELRSIVFSSIEERERWRQGPRCLRCSKLRRMGDLGGLMMAPRRSSGCGACIPELSTHRHRGRLLCLRSRAKASSIHPHFEGGIYTFRRRIRIPYVFSWVPLLVGNTAEVLVSSYLQQVVQSLIHHNYYIHQVQHIRRGVPSKLYVAHTHTRTVTEMFVHILLYSSLYLFEYCCFHPNSGTVHPDIVHRNGKRPFISTVNGSRRVC